MNSKKSNPQQTTHTPNKIPFLMIVTIMLLVVAVFASSALPGIFGQKPKASLEQPILREAILEDGNLKFSKADITNKASFYPYQAGETYMEVLAVEAADGSIRTALNTCQVCYNSGRGYYLQKGDTLVCQNCGNVFGVKDIEVIRGGCNPIPITPEYKTEDASFVTISGAYLMENAKYFTVWEK